MGLALNDNIPARIIQTGKSRDLPLLAKAAVANLKSLNPDFEYLFFDDADVSTFIDQKFPQYRQAFDAFQFNIQRYDFFRYLAVYHYGGFYFDLDVLLASGVEELLTSSCVFPFEQLSINQFLRTRHGLDYEIGNYAFGAARGHPFLKAIIENCLRSQTDAAWVAPMLQNIPPFFRSEYYVLNTTGPGLVSRTLVENPAQAKSVTILFPDDVCDEKQWRQFGHFGVHLMDGSWRTQGNFIYRRLGCLWEDRTMKRLLVKSRQLGRTRKQPHELH